MKNSQNATDQGGVSMVSVESERTPFEVVTLPRGWFVSGEIDASNCADLAAALADVPDVADGPIELDLVGVTFIDSSALRVFLALAERVTMAGGTVAVRNPTGPVARLLRMCDLESTFGLHASTSTPNDAAPTRVNVSPTGVN